MSIYVNGCASIVIVADPMPISPAPYTRIFGAASNNVGFVIVPLAVNSVAVSPVVNHRCGFALNVILNVPDLKYCEIVGSIVPENAAMRYSPGL